jgi:serine protease AprX
MQTVAVLMWSGDLSYRRLIVNRWQRLIRLVVAGMLLIGVCGAVPAATPALLKAQPALLHMAAAQPKARLSVIVQKAEKSDQVEKLVASLGGAVTQDLHIINAFAAELPGQAVALVAEAPGVRWVSLDAPVASSGAPIDITGLASAFVQTVGADRVWNEGPAYLQGQGIGVAVVDSGDCRNNSVPCNSVTDKSGAWHVIAATSVVDGPGAGAGDLYGHGSLVEGLVGGTGLGSGGKYFGTAPGVNLVSVRVANNLGQATTSGVVNGLQWVLNNEAAYNIKVVNLSLNSSVAESYHTSPLAAAVEILWFNGIVVVVSSGNNGTATLYAPANDPFVITVGATDDKGTASLADDVVASFSAYGTTESGVAKPDLVAPGTNLISIVPKTKNKIWKDHQGNYTHESAAKEYYMRVSGTSFSAPVVSGAIALLLQDESNLTPDQVKYRLMATANKNWPGYNAVKAGAGYLDIYASVHGTTTESANTGLTASQLLWTGAAPITWGSVNWNSVNWNSVNWNSVNWNSVNWNSVNWNSDYWGQ